MSDRGSISVEMAVLAPAFLMCFALVVFAGRVQSSRADIEAAAHSAVRSITLSRHPAEAESIAARETAERLNVGAATCRDLAWDAQITATAATVTVACQVDLADAAILPVPGTFTVQATSTEVFDTFTEGS